MEKKYWQSIESYQEQKDNKSVLEKSQPQAEFSVEGLDPEEIRGKSSRRDFLKSLGFSVGAVALASSCQMPVRKAIPLLNQPEHLVPGIADYYASTYFDGQDYCSILVKTREGRPIKVEGNRMSKLTYGGTSARIQASVLNLYDDARHKKPHINKESGSWADLDAAVINTLKTAQEQGGKVALISSTIISPSTLKLMQEFKEAYPAVHWVSYDAVSQQAIRKAHKAQFGASVIPSYHFDKAEIIVGFNADYLGNWMLPVKQAYDFARMRKISKENQKMSRVYHFESHLSITGAAADYRQGIKPTEEAAVLLKLYNTLAQTLGAETFEGPPVNIKVDRIADELLAHKHKTLVVSGTNDVEIQKIVNAINYLLGNYEHTLDISKPVNLYQGNDQAVNNILTDLMEGKLYGIMFYNCNPVYDHPQGKDIAQAIEKLKFSLSFSDRLDETSDACQHIAPMNNYLESWDDHEPVKGSYSLQQPAINPIFDTRQFQDSLLTWMGRDITYDTYIKNHWKAAFFPHQNDTALFTKFWNQSLHDGIFDTEIKEEEDREQLGFNFVGLVAAAPKNDGHELMLYQKMAIGTGKFANNPWQQEMPDPITTATWDNYVCIPVSYAEEQGLKNEDVVQVNELFELPVLVQPGQPVGTVAIALGYGRRVAGKVAEQIGKNAFPLMNGVKLGGTIVKLEKVTGKTYPLATTQEHHTMEERPIIRETILKEWKEDPASGNKMHKLNAEIDQTLYEIPEYDGIHWGMTIDLNSCIGCGACIIACQAENNVAVIGKEQVKNRRIMHWLRLDRYYSENVDNPEVLHMPVMCQHCDNAPCENVCPVAATPHSSEGLNMMAYNRCIGTRYCMNNCPYRVRRFNWFNYVNNHKFDFNMNSELGQMVLNPDVTVRSRGVVEKCSYCSQRLQDGKLKAKLENRPLKEGDVMVACQQACPTQAISFGNLKEKNSKVVELNKQERMYHLLEQLHTLPSTAYLTKVRNKEEQVHLYHEEG